MKIDLRLFGALFSISLLSQGFTEPSYAKQPSGLPYQETEVNSIQSDKKQNFGKYFVWKVLDQSGKETGLEGAENYYCFQPL